MAELVGADTEVEFHLLRKMGEVDVCPKGIFAHRG